MKKFFSKNKEIFSELLNTISNDNLLKCANLFKNYKKKNKIIFLGMVEVPLFVIMYLLIYLKMQVLELQILMKQIL